MLPFVTSHDGDSGTRTPATRAAVAKSADRTRKGEIVFYIVNYLLFIIYKFYKQYTI